MDRFIIAQDVTKLLPKMQVVIVLAYNLINTGENPLVNKFAATTASTAISTLSTYPKVQSLPRIALFRDTLKSALNRSVKKFPQSNEFLYKRLLENNGPLRPINPVVDFYNSVSIKHCVPAGAFDLEKLQVRDKAPLELRRSQLGDTFDLLGWGDTTMRAAPAGEVSYVQGNTVLTRQLAWLQAKQGLVTETTESVIFMSEVFGDEVRDTPSELAKNVADDLVAGLKDFFGVEGRATILGEGLGMRDVRVENACH